MKRYYEVNDDINKIYNNSNKTQELMGGHCKDYKENWYSWYILSIEGCHPCAYVAVDKNHSAYGEDWEDTLMDVVHGGITFNNGYLANCVLISDEKWVFGWDYAHEGDYTTMHLNMFGYNLFGVDWGGAMGKKYSIKEIKKDIKSFVKYLIEYDEELRE